MQGNSLVDCPRCKRNWKKFGSDDLDESLKDVLERTRMKPEVKDAARKMAAELKNNRPDRVPLKDEEILIGRLLNSLFFNPAMVRKIRESTTGSDWNNWEFVHHARRDRTNVKAIKQAVARGKTHLNGMKIGGAKSEPYLMRWTRKEAWDLVGEIDGLGYNLFEVGELAGIKNNPYPDDEDSMSPWRIP